MSTLNLRCLYLSYFLFINKGSFQVLKEIFIGGVVPYKDRTKCHVEEQKRGRHTKTLVISLDHFLPCIAVVQGRAAGRTV